MLKLLYLILFYVIYRFTHFLLLLIAIVQTVLSLFSGEPSQSIRQFGKNLGVYLQQISEFLSYASEEKPYPFSDWPQVPLSKVTENPVVDQVDRASSTETSNKENTQG